MQKAKGKSGNYFIEMFKSLIVALILSLVLILIGAAAVMIFDISTSAIPIITQIIRGLSIVVAALFTMRLPKNGWIRGLVFGVLYTLLTFAVFSLMDTEQGFAIGMPLLNDIAFGAVAGLISGILSVNLRKGKI